MEEKIEERVYFVTRGPINGKVKVYTKGDIWAAYSLLIFCLGLLVTFFLLYDPSDYGYVLVFFIINLTSIFLSFMSGRRGAREYIRKHEGELTK